MGATKPTKHGEMPSSMTETEYRTHPAVSRSELWKMSVSPEKFRYFKENPDIPTDALLFGQAFHKLVLEPEDFFNEFAVAPRVNMRTKAGKAEMEEFSQQNAGKTVITSDMFDQAKAMADSVSKVPFAVQLLNGKHEVPFFWVDDETGVECKCRADVVTRIGDIDIIADLKSCTDASTEKFSVEAVKYGYDFQSAFYTDGIDKCTGRKHIFVFIAVEKKPPYSVNILQADDLFVEHGEMLKQEFLKTYAYCTETGNWYGYLGKDGGVNTLELPAWVAKNM